MPPRATPSVRPVRRLAVRCQKKTGDWGVGGILSTVDPGEVLLRTKQPIDRVDDPAAVLLAYVYSYDQRGGGGETATKGDKQGLGLTTRNTKRCAAQQVLMLLGTLAHHTPIWARHWLTPCCPTLARYGLLRLVRDVGQISGFLVSPPAGQIVAVVLNHAAPLAPGLATALGALLAPDRVAVSLGQT